MTGKRLKGQALVLCAVLLPLFFSVIGLVVDAGMLFSHKRELQNIADSAARAGAMEVDVAVYRRSRGTRVVLDPERAEVAIERYLAGREVSHTAIVKADGVVVRVERQLRLSFLSLLGFGSVTIRGEAPAALRHGITTGSP